MNVAFISRHYLNQVVFSNQTHMNVAFISRHHLNQAQKLLQHYSICHHTIHYTH
ncbi:hypothetical protein BCR42DRAFT_424282 [Absidia repens]|uniref:Uncharacterized protein n=1 Tax=Absidia repens TaxID=90262 RepID=A0A1X2I3Y2_9FUNG|nr:hypothetical protein BCR42DRAFT_424282 [Absidia repens]